MKKEEIDNAIVDILKSNFVQKDSYGIDNYWNDIAKAKEQGKQEERTRLKEEIEKILVFISKKHEKIALRYGEGSWCDVNGELEEVADKLEEVLALLEEKK